jgi:AcrR family transcriptional regulator
MRPDQRMASIEEVAFGVFAERGYSASGLAEIAERAEVSKTLLYHYYPDGRPELMVAVMGGLAHDLLAATGQAVSAPVTAEARLTRFVEAFLGHFVERPEAFRLLFRDPWGSGDPAVVGRSVQTNVELSGQLIEPLARSGAPGAALVTSTQGVIGFLLAATELVLSGQVPPHQAVDASVRFLVAGMAGLDDLAR